MKRISPRASVAGATPDAARRGSDEGTTERAADAAVGTTIEGHVEDHVEDAVERDVESDAERRRLADDAARAANWKRWGTYLAERQWGTVREDYSADGACWSDFPHDHARSRAYRWGEDGLFGFCDRQARLCLAWAFWNGHDPILKERLFGLTGPEGNHGEDVKEAYFYLDATPTHSYCRGLYKYPQRAFPYQELVEENRRRDRGAPEYELSDTGAFDDGRSFDLEFEYAKAAPDDVLVRLTVHNRSAEAAPLWILPTLWFRNTWSWGRQGEGYPSRPLLRAADGSTDGGVDPGIDAEHAELGALRLHVDADDATLLFCDNDTNVRRLFGADGGAPYPKDALHDFVVHGRRDAVNPAQVGTKATAMLQRLVPAHGQVTLRLRLRPRTAAHLPAFGVAFEATFAARRREADAFYNRLLPTTLTGDERNVARQAYAGLLWSKQFYHLDQTAWLQGDPAQPPPPAARAAVARNRDWPHLYNRDVVSMPDKWEYPWFAAWDLAFHALPLARVDAEFAKQQLLLLLREWYMAPNGQIPAYEFAFSDVNPPVHAWACWRVYKMTGKKGARDRAFLARAFHKLLLNFNWWVNRKDPDGKHIFAGGFLGLDNIGVFDRSKPLPTGGHLEQADGTAWMAFYCATMLSIALELAREDAAYEDVASKFFEHFVAITDAMHALGGSGLWDDEDGFYYDQIRAPGGSTRLRIRSMVGLIPLFAVEILEEDLIDRLPGFARRMQWFLANRPELGRHVTRQRDADGHGHLLLAIPSAERLTRVLRFVLDEREFLSPHGVRSLSRVHAEQPFVLDVAGEQHRVRYVPGESDTGLFGGNSNWRGPVWFPVNYLLIEALERYHHFYGDDFRVECPTGSGRMCTLQEVAHELASRLVRIFLPDARGRRPCHGDDARYAADPAWRDLVLFHEYFHGDDGRGIGASHQTGWTALVARCLEDLARMRAQGCTDAGVCAKAARQGQRPARPASDAAGTGMR